MDSTRVVAWKSGKDRVVSRESWLKVETTENKKQHRKTTRRRQTLQVGVVTKGSKTQTNEVLKQGIKSHSDRREARAVCNSVGGFGGSKRPYFPMSNSVLVVGLISSSR